MGLIVHRMKTLMTLKSKMHDKLNAVAIMIHAVWSVSVTTAKGGYCPGGTGKGDTVVDCSGSQSVKLLEKIESSEFNLGEAKMGGIPPRDS